MSELENMTILIYCGSVSELRFLYKGYGWVFCLLVCLHLPVHRDQKRALDPLEWELLIGLSCYWELNLGSPEEQQVLLTSDAFL